MRGSGATASDAGDPDADRRRARGAAGDEAASAPEPEAPPEPTCPAAPSPRLALGERSGIAIGPDGEAYSFMLRPGAAEVEATPIESDVRTAAQGLYGHCLVSTAGALRCVGTVDDLHHDEPYWPDYTALEGFEDVVEVGMGRRHLCARDATGRVRCFGVAPGAHAAELAPFALSLEDEPVAQVATAGWATCAVTTSGRAWCVGSVGRSGVGSVSYGHEPTLVPLDEPVCSVALSERAVCFLAANRRKVYCAGDVGDWYFEDVDLEDDERGPVSAMEQPVREPREVPFEGELRAISAAEDHACALDSAGRVSCVGAPFRSGRTEGFRPVPAAPALGRSVEAIAGGGGHYATTSPRGFTCALRDDDVLCFAGGRALADGAPGATVTRMCALAESDDEGCRPLFAPPAEPAPPAPEGAEAPAEPACRVRDPSGTPLNVRAEPRGSGEVVGTLENGATVELGASRGRWRRIEAPLEGWVWADNVACD